MRVLITGATGFVGTHLCRRLAEEGHLLTILTRDKDSASRRIQLEARAFQWLPVISLPPLEAFEEVDAVSCAKSSPR